MTIAAAVPGKTATSIPPQVFSGNNRDVGYAKLWEHFEPIASVLFGVVSEKHRLEHSAKQGCLRGLQAFLQGDGSSSLQCLNKKTSVALLDFVNAYGVASRYDCSRFSTDPESTQASSQDKARKPQQPEINHQKSQAIQVLDLVVTAHPTQLLNPEFLEGLTNRVQEAKKDGDTQFYQNVAKFIADNLAPREQKPTVEGEHKAAIPFVRNAALAAHKLRKQRSQVHLALGNWIGGDRDGNPLVTAEVLVNNVKANSKLALDFYLQKLGWLDNKRGKKNSIVDLFGSDEKLATEREKIAQKLEATQQCLQQAFNGKQKEVQGEFYANAQGFIDDLNNLRSKTEASCLDNEPKARALGKIDNLIGGVNVKCFHGLSTDLRQNSAKNEEFVAALWGALQTKPQGFGDNYADLAEDKKIDALTYALKTVSVQDLQNAISRVIADQQQSSGGKPSAFEQEWSILQTYKPIQDTFGADALKHHITANNESFSDMLEVAVMLKAAGLVGEDEAGKPVLHMDIMPLVETVEDMRTAPEMLKTALEHDWYKAALESRSSTGKPIQPIMVGYSDSTKGDGVMSAAWALQRCKHDLLNVAQEKGVELMFFHGRGGSTARGASGNIAADLSTVPAQALANTHRETIQGEVLTNLFLSKPGSQKNLQALAQGLQSHAATGVDVSMTNESFKELLNTFAEKSRETYRALFNDPNFSNYFQRATPFEAFSLSNAGSRPSKRPAEGEGLDMANVRAIPYAAAFQQNGTLMPAWYGVGSGLQAVLQAGGVAAEGPLNTDQLQQLKNLYQQSPWFKGVVDRVQVALEQVDLDSALKYAKFGDAQLGPNGNACETLHETIAAEFDLTQKMLNLVCNPGKALNNGSPLAMVRLARELQLQALQNWKAASKQYHTEALCVQEAAKQMATSIQAVAMLMGSFG